MTLSFALTTSPVTTCSYQCLRLAHCHAAAEGIRIVVLPARAINDLNVIVLCKAQHTRQSNGSLSGAASKARGDLQLLLQSSRRDMGRNLHAPKPWPRILLTSHPC